MSPRVFDGETSGQAHIMSFTDDIWQQTAALRRAIDELPFNRELAAGTLSRKRFKFYITQDKLYLDSYARTLAIAGARAPDLGAMDKFVGSALGALAVERALHGQFLEQFGMSEADILAAEPSPSCLAYTNFLIAAAHHGSWPVLVAAILPCFWIYHDVGVRIAAETVPDNFYQPWIDTYADDAFAASVREVIGITDRAAAGAGAAERDAMARAFVRSTQYEWLFWDSAYRLEAWPIAG
jgi:thiaminase (transcriptional activator TenA)